MAYLILKMKPIRQDALMEIMLQGTVSKEVVKNIQIRLSNFKSRFPEVASMIPVLRIEKGYWVFKSQCPSIHHHQILVECFLEAIESSAYRALNRYDKINDFAPAHSTIFKSEQKDIEHCILPGYGTLQGGDFKNISLNSLASVAMAPESSLPLTELAELSAGRLVFGVGWAQTQDKTAKMLGLPNNLDVDLNLYICNKYGEVIQLLSPKGNRSLTKRGRSGVTLRGGILLSLDSQSGANELDDERFAFTPRFLPSYVHSIVICLQIQSGARSFRDVFDVHLRLLDTSVPGIENEHCIFHLDPERRNSIGTCATMGRIIRTEGSNFSFQSIGHVSLVAEQGLKSGVDCKLPSHITLSGFRASIPAMDAKMSLTAKGRKQGTTDPFLRVYIEYWVKIAKYSITTEQMKGNVRASHHGLVLKQGGRSGQVIVKYVIDETPAQASGFKPGDLILQMNSSSVNSAAYAMNHLDRMNHRDAVKFLIYRQGQQKFLNMRIGGPLERKLKMLWKSDVQSKVPCPATVDFKGCPEIKVMPASMTGKLQDSRIICRRRRFGLLVIDCLDRDRMSRNDKIFRHEVEMDMIFDEDLDHDSDWFKTTEQKPIDYDIHSNGTFTHCQLFLKAQRFA